MIRIILGVYVLLSSTIAAFAAEQPPAVSGYSFEKALRLGEQMYRKGVLPSGEHIEATVQGDIPVDGIMFTCESCHLRSGLGSVEGTIVTLPTNGADLYRDYSKGSEMVQPMRKNFSDQFQKNKLRPAYTDDSLAEALLLGVDPSGRQLNDIMPEYDLNEKNMEIMVHYLKNLTVEFSPGIDEETITLATVVTDDVPENKKKTMYEILDAYVRDKNSQDRYQERRAKEGPFYKLETYTVYRRIDLKKWELHGESDTWQSQLEEYYKKDNVFALIGGISTKEWKPIHNFCEQNKIPSLFPITDFPVISNSDWYTLYLSKGVYQEGESVARYLRGTKENKSLKILQVIREKDMIGEFLSRGFEETRKLLKQFPPENMIVKEDETIDDKFWKKLVNTHKADIFILWLSPVDLRSIDALAGMDGGPRQVFISSTQQKEAIYVLPRSVRDFVYITYPYELPEDGHIKKLAMKKWLKIRKIENTDMILQGKLFFLNRILTGALADMRRDYYRDRFLEEIDMMIDQYYTAPVHPNMSFGPAQRYASKGCYIVQLDNGDNPKLVKKSAWVNH
jgi:hypothetical protein